MKIVYNNIIPFKGFKAVNILGVMFARRGARVSDVLVNHERIHTAQMREMLYVFFYLWYFVEWLVKLCYFRDSKVAYHYISFECEAFRHQHDDDYLPRRKHFTWLKYIRKQA